MRNLKLIIEYDGTDYAGWQIQREKGDCPRTGTVPFFRTIQATIEKTLQKILQEKVKLIASGRTDAGVHAFGQVANFKTNSSIPPENLKRALNSLLPKDIAIKNVEETPLDFHSRFSAKFKSYRYLILNSASPNPFLRNYAYFYPYPLDIELMRKGAKCLLGKRDFKSFCASGSRVKDTARTVKYLYISRQPSVKKRGHFRTSKVSPFFDQPPSIGCPEEGDCPRTGTLPFFGLISIDIKADGFLYNMVRNIIGTLIEIGRGKLPVASLKKILLSKNRSLAGPTASAKGLFLVKVEY